MHVNVTVDQGEAASYYTCATCQEIYAHIWDKFDDGLDEGWTLDEMSYTHEGKTPEEYLQALEDMSDADER
jgi:hypothetical protein